MKPLLSTAVSSLQASSQGLARNERAKVCLFKLSNKRLFVPTNTFSFKQTGTYSFKQTTTHYISAMAFILIWTKLTLTTIIRQMRKKKRVNLLDNPGCSNYSTTSCYVHVTHFFCFQDKNMVRRGQTHGDSLLPFALSRSIICAPSQEIIEAFGLKLSLFSYWQAVVMTIWIMNSMNWTARRWAMKWTH